MLDKPFIRRRPYEGIIARCQRQVKDPKWLSLIKEIKGKDKPQAAKPGKKAKDDPDDEDDLVYIVGVPTLEDDDVPDHDDNTAFY